jgi:hypothetical protein
MNTELCISSRVQGSLTVVELSGRLDLSGATRLLSELPSFAQTGSRVVVCDLSQLQTPAEPYLLTVFAAAQRHSGAWPRSAIHLAAPGPELDQRLRWLGVPRFVPLHPTLELALAVAAADVADNHSDLVMIPDASNGAAAEHALSAVWADIEPEHQAHQDALRVTRELTSYAGRDSSSPFTVSMALSCQRFMVSVTDDSRYELVEHPILTRSNHSRALQLVTELSQQWGVRLVHERGKTVWAALLRHDLAKVGA